MTQHRSVQHSDNETSETGVVSRTKSTDAPRFKVTTTRQASINETSMASIEMEPPLRIIREREVYREQNGADYTVTAIDAVVRKTGRPVTLHVTSVKDARPGAVCIAVREDDATESSCLLLARHWRAAIKGWQWEFPRGMGEEGETATQTAIRELREETGLHASEDDVHILQMIHADAGVLHDATAIAAITVSSNTPQDSCTDWELSDMRWIPVPQFQTMIAANDIIDGITLAAWAVWNVHMNIPAQRDHA